MINWGDVPLGAVLPFPFATYGKTNGESITLTGLAVTDIEVYKGTSMTQRSSDAGFVLLDTDGIDIDATTGIHGFSIDTADNTDAGFYVAGSLYYVIVSAVTVDAQTVNFVAGTFRLVTAENTAGIKVVDLVRVAGATTDVSALATNVAAILVDTGTTLDGKIDTIDGIVDSVLVDTAEIGAAGAGLTNINLPNQTMDIIGNITGNLSGSVGSVTGAVASVTAGVTLANDAITAAKFDESTAFPLKADDSGTTAVARVNRLSVLVTKTATVQTDGGNSATQIKTDLTETATDHFKDCLVKITSGALAEQVKKCTGYNGTTKALSFTSGFTGVPADGVSLEVVNE